MTQHLLRDFQQYKSACYSENIYASAAMVLDYLGAQLQPHPTKPQYLSKMARYYGLWDGGVGDILRLIRLFGTEYVPSRPMEVEYAEMSIPTIYDLLRQGIPIILYSNNIRNEVVIGFSANCLYSVYPGDGKAYPLPIDKAHLYYGGDMATLRGFVIRRKAVKVRKVDDTEHKIATNRLTINNDADSAQEDIYESDSKPGFGIPRINRGSVPVQDPNIGQDDNEKPSIIIP